MRAEPQMRAPEVLRAVRAEPQMRAPEVSAELPPCLASDAYCERLWKWTTSFGTTGTSRDFGLL